MTEPELIPEAKKAIKNYMLKVVAVPGIFLTILGFFVGFFINDVAKQSAYNKAYEKASDIILKLTSDASKAAYESEKVMSESEKILKEVKQIRNEINTILNEADAIRAKLHTAEAFQKSEKLVKEVAKTLIDRSDFKKLLNKEKLGIHLFSTDKYVPLWTAIGGGPHTYNVSRYIPKNARGILLKVIMVSNNDKTGSFVCSDKYGRFSNSTELKHFQQNGFSNYSDKWIGGVVFCPVTEDHSIIWKTISPNGNPVKDILSYGTLIGWF